MNPEDNVRTMNRQDMDEMKAHYADCALRCKHAGFRMVMIHCAHQNFLAQWLSPASNVRTDEYGGSPENRRRYPLEVLKAVRELSVKIWSLRCEFLLWKVFRAAWNLRNLWHL